MGFFDTLRHVLKGNDISVPTTRTVGLANPGARNSPSAEEVDSAEASLYDRVQWVKKLKRILDELPESQGEWAELQTEAKALDLDPSWVAATQREEFQLQVRRAVADRVVTVDEHRKLDLCRDLIGISDAEAEETLHAIMAEAESFFGKPVREA